MKQIEIYADNQFKRGFQVHGPQHEDGFVGYLLPAEEAEETTDWLIGQWGCKRDIQDGEKEYGPNFYAAHTESQRIEVDSDRGHVLLELNASREFEHARSDGEDWPHLLLAQNSLGERCPTLDTVSSMELTLSARIIKCDDYMEQPDTTLHCAQTTLFFTVGDLAGEDFWWFGVPIFDNRDYIRKEYMAVDRGKEDASGKFIYIMAQEDLTEQSFHAFEWITYQKELMPYLQKGLKEAKKRGYLSSDSLADYRLTSSNLGWENTGTYDTAMEIEGLHLLCTFTSD